MHAERGAGGKGKMEDKIVGSRGGRGEGLQINLAGGN